MKIDFTKDDFEQQAEAIASKLTHYLITQIGCLPQQAQPIEIFQALSFVLREMIIVNWSATNHTINEKKMRRIYYLSMEYLPGRMLTNNITNVHAHPLMKRVAHICNFDYRTVLTQEPDPGLGNGGLGRLASCLLDSMATQRFPAFAYGLRYQYGIFEQQLWEGAQVESPDCWLLYHNPWGLRCDREAKTVKFAGNCRARINQSGESYHDLEEYEMVRALAYDYPIIGYASDELFSVATLRLWSTKESPRNFQLQRYNSGELGHAAENTGLTDVLYPNDDNDVGKRVRLKQEFLLVSSSLQDIIERHKQVYTQMENFEDKVRIQINDTHPALVVAELIRLLIKHDSYTFERALEVTQKVVSYTNHTILPEALEEWNEKRVSELLPRQYWVIEKLNQKFLHNVRTQFPQANIEQVSIFRGDQIRMANLAIVGSHKVNAVAKLHGKIIKEYTFREFASLYPDKFTYVTNGVTQRHWILHANPILGELIKELIGDSWIMNFSEIAKLREYASDRSVQEKFLDIKRRNKERLIGHMQMGEGERDFLGNKKQWSQTVDPAALFDVQVKRLHEYKRQLMNALHLLMVYQELLENPESRPIKRVAIVGGKAAAGYTMAKHIIRLFYMLGRTINNDVRIKDKLKIFFIENYSVTKAESIIPAAELSEQISTAGMEASGTGNMKFAMNAALTIGTEDGANIEMRESVGDASWPFSFGAQAEELVSLQNYNPWDIYSSVTKVRRAIDALREGAFTQTESEKEVVESLYSSLMEGYRPDRYYVLHDLMSYYETQKKVEACYLDPYQWTKKAIDNLAGMGPFSSDRAVQKYAKEIWEVEPCPVDSAIFNEVKETYMTTVATSSAS